MKIKLSILIVILFSFVACGGAGEISGRLGSGSLAISIKSPDIFDANIDHGKTDLYRISITASDIENAIIAEFSGDAEEGVIDDVPTGGGRQVEVRAINENGATVFMGEALDVSVGGGTNDVEVEIESVPVFTNLNDGNVVQNTRLNIELFFDPEHPIVIDAIRDDSQISMVNASTNVPEVYADESTWLGSMSPSILERGDYTFIAQNPFTGRKSKVSVRIIDGRNSRPAPLVAGSVAGNNSTSSISTGLLSEVFQ